MKMITWNVHGLGGVEKRRFIRECISKYKPAIIVLQETKKEVMNKSLVRSSVGPRLSEWCALPTIETCGGVLIAWDPLEFSGHEIMGNFSVSMKIFKKSFGFEWKLSGVHGPCKPQNRTEFWDELKHVHTQ